MKSVTNSLHWFVFYAAIAWIFHLARLGDAYAQAAFPALIILRSLAMIVVAFAMDTAWYQPRSAAMASLRFGAEAMTLLGLLVNGNNVAAVISVLTILLYEFARARVSYQA
jgi:hypothetical protein